jgi:hypothetical protein
VCGEKIRSSSKERRRSIDPRLINQRMRKEHKIAQLSQSIDIGLCVTICAFAVILFLTKAIFSSVALFTPSSPSAGIHIGSGFNLVELLWQMNEESKKQSGGGGGSNSGGMSNLFTNMSKTHSCPLVSASLSLSLSVSFSLAQSSHYHHNNIVAAHAKNEENEKKQQQYYLTNVCACLYVDIGEN